MGQSSTLDRDPVHDAESRLISAVYETIFKPNVKTAGGFQPHSPANYLPPLPLLF
jgi:hypothetical protein